MKFRNFDHDTFISIRYEDDELTGNMIFISLSDKCFVPYSIYRVVQFHTVKLIIVMKFQILVSHDLDNKRAWTTCINVKGVTLPTGYYFGASAITGNRRNYHSKTRN